MEERIIAGKYEISRIKAVLGSVTLPSEVVNQLITEEDIKIHAIRPALEEYFRWFPLKIEETYELSGLVNIPFPEFTDKVVFGSVDARVQNYMPVTGGSNSELSRIVMLSQFQSNKNRKGAYGTKQDFGGQNRANYYGRAVQSAQLSQIQNTKLRVNLDERALKGTVNGSSMVSVKWACWCLDFSKISFERKEQVINLAQSYLLSVAGMSANLIQDSKATTKINSEGIMAQAKEMKDSILKEWSEVAKPVVIPRDLGFSNIMY